MQQLFYKYFPILFFSIIWILVFFFLSLDLYNIHPVTNTTWVILLCGIFSFILGYIIVLIYDSNFFPENPLIQSVSFNYSYCAKLTIVFFLLSILGSFITMVIIGDLVGEGLASYTKSPIAVRNQYIQIITNPLEAPPLLFKIGSYLTSFSFVGTYVAGMLLTADTRIRLLGFLPIVAAFFNALVTLGRYSLVNSLGFILVSFIIFSFYFNKEKRKKLLQELMFVGVIIFAISALLIYSVASIRVVTDIDVAEYIYKTVYFYFSGGAVALDDFLKTDLVLNYGTSSFRTFFGWLARFGLFSENEIIQGFDPFTKVSPTLQINTYTFVKSPYSDFGILGVLGMSFIWGASIKILLKRVYHHFSLMRVFWPSVFIFGAVMSFYSFYFQSITQIFFWALSIGIVQFFFGNKIATSSPAT